MSTVTELTVEIVTAYASNNPMTADELISQINKVHAALKALEAGEQIPAEKEEVVKTISPKASIKKNEIICLVCNKGGFKTLTRHLKSAHNMKPKDYKKQFGIPSKQPLSAKNLTESRKQIATERGLADNLAKARAARKAKAPKAAKAPKLAKASKAAAKTK